MEPSPRNIKRSFVDYVDDIEQHAEQTSDATHFRQALTTIHSEAVNTFTDFVSVNGVFGVKPPSVAEEELELHLE